MKTIYDLELHESRTIDDGLYVVGNKGKVIRVPGGWIYMNYNGDRYNSTFVPYNVEFDPRYMPTESEDPPEYTLPEGLDY